jgi:hypothetical protein
MSGTVPVRAWDIYRIMNPDAPLLRKSGRRIYSNSPETMQEQLLILEVAHLIKLDLHDLNCSILVSYSIFAPFLRCFSFEMAVSMALLKRVGCPNAILSIKPSSTKEEVVLVEDAVILALTVDITFIKLKSNRCRLRR